MKKFRSIYILVLIALTSCLDDITSINKNPKGYEKVPGDMFFANGTRNLTDAITYGVTFKVLAQQWSETTYTDASRYNLPNIGNGFWNSIYRDVLRDYKEAVATIGAETDLDSDPLNRKNRLDIVNIMQVYAYSILVNTFGNIPYTEALDVENPQPKYDDALTIYQDLFKRLDASLASLEANADKGSFGAEDIVYGGDVAHWIKFGYSLKLRLALTLADSNPAIAKPAAEAAFASGELFASNGDNAEVIFDANPPNTNQIWVNLVQSGREDYVASNTMMDMLTNIQDPRIPSFFTANKFNGYTGGKFGVSNNFGNFSHAGSMIVDPKFSGTLLDYTEVEFYLAEAVVRGYTITGTAASHYNAAIEASFADWAVSDAHTAIGVAVGKGGLGYKVGDTLSVDLRAQDLATKEATVTVQSLSDQAKGIISQVKILDGGVYLKSPTLKDTVNTTTVGLSVGTGAKVAVLIANDIATYMARDEVKFSTAAGTDLQKIARQKYLAMYNRGLEAWTEYRRFDFPVLNKVPEPLGEFPIRYTYPVNEQNLNNARWAEASTAIGKDELTTRVFWDTK